MSHKPKKKELWHRRHVKIKLLKYLFNSYKEVSLIFHSYGPVRLKFLVYKLLFGPVRSEYFRAYLGWFLRLSAPQNY